MSEAKNKIKTTTLRLTSWTVVDILEVFEFPLCPRCSLVSSPFPLFVLESPNVSELHTKAVVTLPQSCFYLSQQSQSLPL